jgi:hypothetical protein
MVEINVVKTEFELLSKEYEYYPALIKIALSLQSVLSFFTNAVFIKIKLQCVNCVNGLIISLSDNYLRLTT